MAEISLGVGVTLGPVVAAENMSPVSAARHMMAVPQITPALIMETVTAVQAVAELADLTGKAAMAAAFTPLRVRLAAAAQAAAPMVMNPEITITVDRAAITGSGLARVVVLPMVIMAGQVHLAVAVAAVVVMVTAD